jgi:hypothetical protein
MPSELPITYRERRGCHNCARVFVKTDWDAYPEYYCTVGASVRPLCLSAGMDETGHDYGDDYRDDDARARRRRAWEQWSKGREVSA